MKYIISKGCQLEPFQSQCLVSSEEGEVLILNALAWESIQMLLNGKEVEEIIDFAVKRYEVSPRVLKSDFEGLVNLLVTEHVLECVA